MIEMHNINPYISLIFIQEYIPTNITPCVRKKAPSVRYVSVDIQNCELITNMQG